MSLELRWATGVGVTGTGIMAQWPAGIVENKLMTSARTERLDVAAYLRDANFRCDFPTYVELF